MTPPLVAEMVCRNGVFARPHFFTVKSTLRHAADRTTPVDCGAHLFSCATLISFALSEKFGIGSKKNGNALVAVYAYSEPIADCSFSKAKFRGELAQPV